MPKPRIDQRRMNLADTQMSKYWGNTDQGQAVAGQIAGNAVNTVFNPLAWYGLISGNQDPASKWLQDNGLSPTGSKYHDIAWGALPDQEGAKSVFKQMDQEQWNELSGLDPSRRAAWIQNRANELKNGTGRPPGTFVDPETGESGYTPDELADIQDQIKAEKDKAEADKKYADWRQQTMERLDAFSKDMGLSVDELIAKGDSGIKYANQIASTQARNAAFNAGVGEGGLGTMNTQRAVADASQRYQLQRQQMGQQAMGQLLGEFGNIKAEDFAQQGLNEKAREFDTNTGLAIQDANEAARMRGIAEQQKRSSGLFATAGGIVGGIYGGPTGAAFGSQLGGGLGGSMGPSYKPTYFKQPPTTPRYGSSNPYTGTS